MLPQRGKSVPVPVECAPGEQTGVRAIARADITFQSA